MRLAKLNLTGCSYPKTQIFRYSNNAPAAFKRPSFLAKSQNSLTSAAEDCTIQRNSYETKVDPSAVEEYDYVGESIHGSQEDYLKYFTFRKDPRGYFTVGKIFLFFIIAGPVIPTYSFK